MLALSHHLEITRIVIVNVAIDVMHDLAWEKWSPELLLSDHTMLVSAVILRIGRSIVLDQRLSLTLTLLRLTIDRLIDSDDLLRSSLAISLADVS